MLKAIINYQYAASKKTFCLYAAETII